MSIKQRAFDAGGSLSIKLSLTTTAATGLAVVRTMQGNADGQVRIANAGSSACFYSYSVVDAATAQANAVLPTGAGANSKACYYLPAGAVEVISVPSVATIYFSGITIAGTCDLYICSGSGL